MDTRGKPIGGKYSYDKYNRQPIRTNQITDVLKTIKTTIKKYEGIFYEASIKYCEKTFKNYYKDNYEPDNIYYYPITHADSKAHYKKFLKHKIKYFGLYQDAMIFSSGQNDLFASMTLFHSICSIQLNNGLLTPSYVQKLIIDYYHVHKNTLYPIEAFIRQLNWREYVRFIYLYEYENIIHKNYFNNNRHLTSDWYRGTTGIEPVDQAIKFAFRFGYLHHIIRLMVMCNFMNLCQIHPTDVYRWFMEFSLDSYDWVMIANVYSMGLYADGGLVTTKPYISSSNYILRMAHIDNSTSDWETIWKVLYYFFIYRNGSKIKGRGQLYLSHWSKQSNKKLIIKNAIRLIKKLSDK
jgi:deoxyribodipyrimidine photolyase-related protein